MNVDLPTQGPKVANIRCYPMLPDPKEPEDDPPEADEHGGGLARTLKAIEDDPPKDPPEAP